MADMLDVEGWVLGLVVGSEVAVHRVGMSEGVTIETVTERARNSRTRQLVKVGNSGWFNRRGRQEPYRTWAPSIAPVTQADREAIRRKELLARMAGVKWDEVSTETIESVLGIVESKASGARDSDCGEAPRDG